MPLWECFEVRRPPRELGFLGEHPLSGGAGGGAPWHSGASKRPCAGGWRGSARERKEPARNVGVPSSPSLLPALGGAPCLRSMHHPPHSTSRHCLGHETLYVGIDVGKLQHVAGFVSQSLLARHQRFESCPALSFANSREGFRALGDRLRTYVPLTQIYALLEVTGHYHKALVQYLQELDIPVYLMHVQKRQAGLLKSDKRDALGLANHLYNTLEKGVQTADPLQAVRRLAPPTEAATQLQGMVQHREELVAECTSERTS